MKKQLWKSKAVSMTALALKLSEEAAEVGKVVSSAEAYNPFDWSLSEKEKKQMLKELDHVDFISSQIRQRIQGGQSS